jgi:hypothetical protein
MVLICGFVVVAMHSEGEYVYGALLPSKAPSSFNCASDVDVYELSDGQFVEVMDGPAFE